jgi:hypothetical protein
LGTASSNHPGGADINGNGPPISICQGEKLLAKVYKALHNAPNNLFEKTLLIVTYDEHGGCYDHMPPPAAVSPFPSELNVQGFNFDRYGVRVPNIFIFHSAGNDLSAARRLAAVRSHEHHRHALQTVWTCRTVDAARRASADVRRADQSRESTQSVFTNRAADVQVSPIKNSKAENGEASGRRRGYAAHRAATRNNYRGNQASDEQS